MNYISMKLLRKRRGGSRCSSMAEYLPIMLEVFGLISSTAKGEKREQREGRRNRGRGHKYAPSPT
jgi:hypothetical protein